MLFRRQSTNSTAYRPTIAASTATFAAKNTRMKEAVVASGSYRYRRKAMRLASDAMGVPKPPRSTPMSSEC